MIDAVLAGLATMAIGAIVVAIYRQTWFGGALDLVVINIRGLLVHGAHSSTHSVKSFRRKILRLLVTDQSMIGAHKGQFGKSVSFSDNRKWQMPKSKEKIGVKPRMYLTSWPTLVMLRHRMAPRTTNIAKIGVERLFKNGKIYVAQSVSKDMSPTEMPLIVSYRHTMAGALILAAFDKWNANTRSVVDVMLDANNRWQRDDGGWRQAGDGFESADLWASAYAARLLDECVDSRSPYSAREKSHAAALLASTLDFLELEWEENGWAFGRVPAKENAPLLFIDLASTIKKHRPSLESDCIAIFSSWLSLGGDLSDSYRRELTGIPTERLYARMAYVFFLTDPKSNKWRVLFERLAHRHSYNLFSCDMAFVLDMSFEYSNEANRKIRTVSIVNN